MEERILSQEEQEEGRGTRQGEKRRWGRRAIDHSNMRALLKQQSERESEQARDTRENERNAIDKNRNEQLEKKESRMPRGRETVEIKEGGVPGPSH